jgi:two-component system chemotaxis sensor kinase CheA
VDELLRDFLTETGEHLEGVETQLVQFERNPRDASLVTSIFRLLHTIKGTSSFLGLDRLQHVAHAAETLIGELRDGARPTQRKVSLILAAIDRIKAIVGEIEKLGAEPEGDDAELIQALEANVGASGEAEETDLDADAAAAPAVGALVPAGLPPAVAGAQAKSRASAAKATPAGAAPAASAPGKSAETIRVAVDTIERIMQLVSELVLTRNQLLELTRHRESDSVKAPLQRLSGLTTDLQDAVMRARMQPVGRLFSNLPRLVRELSAELGKKIDLITKGAETELDRQLIEVLRDPLTHLIRNCADHGLEPPEERLAAGKSEFGEIRVSASHEAGQITIKIADDGRGLNLEKIKAKALANGLVTEQALAQMAPEEISRFIFEPGFSTAQKLTGVSGRGVGMDVVRSNIESIGGSVSLITLPGRGSRFTLRIPLTLAIAPALIVKVGEQRFALPQSAVMEAVGLGAESRHHIETVQNALVLRLRDEVVPVVDLHDILSLGGPAEQTEEQLVVILRVGADTIGVRVDAVLDVQEIVVKPLNASLAHLKIFTGQTILGDGSVVLILDPGGIAQELGLENSTDRKRDAEKASGPEERIRLVLFRAGEGLPKVLPLSLLARIEMVEAGRIERSGGRLLMQHQGRLMPLLPIAPGAELTRTAHPVLVINAQERAIGLLVEEIIDIVEERLEVQLPSEAENVIGSAEIKGEPVELIDVTYYLQTAASSFFQQEARRILYADADPFFRDTLLPVLTSAGYRVTTAPSAAELLQTLEASARFDALLVDAAMTDDDGDSVVKLLRGALLADDIPLLRLHEASPPAVLGIAADHPMTMDVSKLDRQNLLGMLSSLLSRRERDASQGYLSRDIAA